MSRPRAQSCRGRRFWALLNRECLPALEAVRRNCPTREEAKGVSSHRTVAVRSCCAPGDAACLVWLATIESCVWCTRRDRCWWRSCLYQARHGATLQSGASGVTMASGARFYNFTWCESRPVLALRAAQCYFPPLPACISTSSGLGGLEQEPWSGSACRAALATCCSCLAAVAALYRSSVWWVVACGVWCGMGASHCKFICASARAIACFHGAPVFFVSLQLTCRAR